MVPKNGNARDWLTVCELCIGRRELAEQTLIASDARTPGGPATEAFVVRWDLYCAPSTCRGHPAGDCRSSNCWRPRTFSVRDRDRAMTDSGEIERSELLEGLEGKARQERAELVRWLQDKGFDSDQIANSLSPVLLPVNRVFGDDGTLASREDVAQSSGVPLELIDRLHRAVALPRVEDPGMALHSRADAESILPAAALLAASSRPGEIVLIVRQLMESLSNIAVAVRHAALQSRLQPGATEIELAQALEELAHYTEPLIDPVISQLTRLALRRAIESEAISAAERASGTLPGARLITVAFADVVGFTQLGEVLPPEELGEVAARLSDLTREVVTEPVQFVKTIGDAVMLVSTNAQQLLGAVMQLLEVTAAERFPRLRAGVASGLAATRAGDWFGHPVNLANRITGVATPDTVLVSEDARRAIGDAPWIAWSPVTARRLRGIHADVRLYAASRATAA